MDRHSRVPVTVVIPTYRRERVLVQTIESLLALPIAPAEVVVVDQSERHEAATELALDALAAGGSVRIVKQAIPSIPAAMNRGLVEASNPIVLFLDDDVVPAASLVEAHWRAHQQAARRVVAGRVIQPWHADGSTPMEGFSGTCRGEVTEFMGGNVSLERALALEVGGFDERFVRVAFRFEAELAARLRAAGARIEFEPDACLDHLKVSTGGTRSYGDHLRTFSPAHTVGEYYFLLRTRPPGWGRRFLSRFARAGITRHHARRPWWIVPSLVAEAVGMIWATLLWASGPKLLRRGQADG